MLYAKQRKANSPALGSGPLLFVAGVFLVLVLTECGTIINNALTHIATYNHYMQK